MIHTLRSLADRGLHNAVSCLDDEMKSLLDQQPKVHEVIVWGNFCLRSIQN